MTERLNFNPLETSMGPLILNDGDYTFLFEDAQVFDRVSGETAGEEKKVYGIGVRAKVLEGPENVGKSIYLQFFYHTDGMFGMIKQFLAAAYGFKQKEEEQFNSFIVENGKTWDNNWEEKIAAPIWKDIVGRTATATVIKKPNPKNPLQINNQFRWNPAGS